VLFATKNQDRLKKPLAKISELGSIPIARSRNPTGVPEAVSLLHLVVSSPPEKTLQEKPIPPF
jgi:hypothetical protein